MRFSPCKNQRTWSDPNLEARHQEAFWTAYLQTLEARRKAEGEDELPEAQPEFIRQNAIYVNGLTVPKDSFNNSHEYHTKFHYH